MFKDTRVDVRQDVPINLFAILTQRLWPLVTRRTSEINSRRRLFLKTGSPSTLKKKPRLLIHIKWTWERLLLKRTRTLKLFQRRNRWSNSMMRVNQYWPSPLTWKISRTGEMDRVIYSMKRVHSTRSTLCHSKEILNTWRVIRKNNREN